MPPEEDVKAEAGHGSNITQPFVTETYRCVALYETKDTKNKPFKVAADEKVDVLIKDKAGERHSWLGRAAQSRRCHPSNVWFVQVGGWWRMKKRGWPGSLRPTWRSSRRMGMKMT